VTPASNGSEKKEVLYMKGGASTIFTGREGEPGNFEFDLIGPAGEKIDLWRTLVSNGISSLPPMRVDEDSRTMEVTLASDGDVPRTVTIREGPHGRGILQFRGRAPGKRKTEKLLASARRILRLDEDLSSFYALAEEDPDLAWATAGAGRLIQSATVFEDVIKTVCTTNCSWSATERMVGALCEHLGEHAPGAPENGPWGRAFPTPEAMASAGEPFYREVARAGYRSRYLIEISQSVCEGSVNLEGLAKASPEELPDDELADRLMELPGVGPYAAAHIMLTIGRYSRLIFDSWTRPKYALLRGRDIADDHAIEKRFRHFGRYAGLAFWLYLTRDWVDEAPQSPEPT
jgi:N-glycosylase/DNA lyase